MPNNVTFAQQICHAQHQAMQDDSTMLAMGLGIDDPKAIFGTTANLRETFGHERVFDMPTAENAMTGIGIGAAIAGSRVLMTHQRLDFFLLAMDQLVNNAAKWHYMFNGKMSVPLTIRLIIGRGWGQGPTHAQNLQAWFAHIPGLKVIVPSRTENVANQLYQAIMDNNPVVFIEHRWLHQQVSEQSNIKPLHDEFETTSIYRTGEDVTLVANSYMLPEAMRAANFLAQQNVSCEVIDTCALHDIDWSKINNSVKKTGRLVVCDSARKSFSCGAEIVAKVCEESFSYLKQSPVRLGLPDYPEPTSFALTKDFYVDADKIVNQIGSMLNVKITDKLAKPALHDVPGDWFKGPF
ncbi:alpha-ketoacid dehydrogenase subunit beta [Paraglaciecola polaris]|uniref:alpha-ketoacid dehydrogenase subunit beta n=1 Tax=Paraglaciecola polaris TaxID=222814 RepID=UPI0030EC688C|tara:strand:+ start:2825 stop:3877 length:1053 start_codon:yes stop_codon:yes gene_type:complete